jgi:hypothetical protein
MILAPFAIPATVNITSLENYFKLPPGSILKKTRVREILMPRQIAIWLDHHEYMEKYHVVGWSIIARAYNFDRASIRHSVKTVNDDLNNKLYKKMMYDIQTKIYGQVRYPHAPQVTPVKKRISIY